jgi:cell division protein FtsI (penicillin-binding protein 3)
MEHPVDARAARRVIRIGQVALLWALIVAARLVQLQVIKHDELTAAARAQHHQSIEIPADRGEILDRTGHPLAISVRTKSVVIHPQRVGNPEFFAGMVGPVAGWEPAELSRRIRELQERAATKGQSRGYLNLKRHIGAEEERRLRQLPFRFLEFQRDWRREYPNGATGAHVVGSVDKYNHGNSGLEQRLNDELKGEPGRMRALTDAVQDRYYSWVEKESTQGANVTLSIHSVIQHEVERFLAEGVRISGAQMGSVVVMDPRNGEVLALANYPSFDPREEIPETPAVKRAALERRQNTAVSAPCEPGSVMKMITVTMGLDSGRFTPETPVFCENGSFPRPGRRPIRDVHGYGVLPVSSVLIKSSNIGVAKISLAMGQRSLWEYLKKFGMGERTGIELPGESRGTLRKLECAGPRDNWCWSQNSHEYIAFGHEISATALQLARATAVIANGGLLVQPRVVLKRERPRAGGGLETEPAPRPEPQRVLRAETAFTVRRIMQQVVEEGTGRRARVPGYSSGGKTGSAEVFENGAYNRGKHNSSFIGFAPVANPRIVVVVTLNGTPRQGGAVAAPVFSKVALAALRVLQVPKDEPETDVKPAQLLAKHGAKEPKAPAAPVRKAEPEPEQKQEPVFDGLLAGPRVPDFRGKPVVAVLRESAALGMPVEIVGQGRAREQKPPPGAILPVGARIQVEFARP